MEGLDDPDDLERPVDPEGTKKERLNSVQASHTKRRYIEKNCCSAFFIASTVPSALKNLRKSEKIEKIGEFYRFTHNFNRFSSGKLYMKSSVNCIQL